MLAMQQVQIIKGNARLLRPIPLLDSALTDVGLAPEIDNAGQWLDVHHLIEALVGLHVEVVLVGAEVVAVAHARCEDVAVCQDAALGNAGFGGGLQVLVGLPRLAPRHKGVALEGQAPTLGLVVVQVEKVEPGLADVLP
jgi:hypothetical protein